MRGLRRSVKKRIRWGVLIVAVQVFLLFLCQTLVKQKVTKEYETRLAAKEAILEAAGRLVYITKETVSAGEVFTEQNVEKRYVLSEQDPDTLKVEAIGAVACVDLPAGVILNTSVCRSTEYGVSERVCTFREILYSECFDAYDLVDVRIRYGNGENYCVLRNKRLLPTEDEKECCFILDETEQLLMSAAEFDAATYGSAELFLVGVPQEAEEGELLSAFLPSKQVLLQLMDVDKSNKVYSETGIELRNALEQRLLEHKNSRK